MGFNPTHALNRSNLATGVKFESSHHCENSYTPDGKSKPEDSRLCHFSILLSLEPAKRLAVRILHCAEQFIEAGDPSVVRCFIFGKPLIAPGEDRDAPVDKFFGAWPMAVNDPVGQGPGVSPEHVGE